MSSMYKEKSYNCSIKSNTLFSFYYTTFLYINFFLLKISLSVSTFASLFVPTLAFYTICLISFFCICMYMHFLQICVYAYTYDTLTSIIKTRWAITVIDRISLSMTILTTGEKVS